MARLTSQAAAGLGLPAAEQERLRRAALVHDLGKIAVPYHLLQESGDDTQAASHGDGGAGPAEPIRLHPYFAQRILSRVRPLADLAADVSAHHERLDGSGYPLGLAAPNISVGARLLAAADTWAERGGHGPADRAGDDGLDPACTAALRSSTGRGTDRRRQSPDAGPAGPALSPRELQVLRLLADGASNPDISKTLYISRRTAEHHVEHILAKLTVSSRTAAVAYALTHELLS